MPRPLTTSPCRGTAAIGPRADSRVGAAVDCVDGALARRSRVRTTGAMTRNLAEQTGVPRQGACATMSAPTSTIVQKWPGASFWPLDRAIGPAVWRRLACPSQSWAVRQPILHEGGPRCRVRPVTGRATTPASQGGAASVSSMPPNGDVAMPPRASVGSARSLSLFTPMKTSAMPPGARPPCRKTPAPARARASTAALGPPPRGRATARPSSPRAARGCAGRPPARPGRVGDGKTPA